MSEALGQTLGLQEISQLVKYVFSFFARVGFPGFKSISPIHCGSRAGHEKLLKKLPVPYLYNVQCTYTVQYALYARRIFHVLGIYFLYKFMFLG
jgi:hypothetical protein